MHGQYHMECTYLWTSTWCSEVPVSCLKLSDVFIQSAKNSKGKGTVQKFYTWWHARQSTKNTRLTEATPENIFKKKDLYSCHLCRYNSKQAPINYRVSREINSQVWQLIFQSHSIWEFNLASLNLHFKIPIILQFQEDQTGRMTRSRTHY